MIDQTQLLWLWASNKSVLKYVNLHCLFNRICIFRFKRSRGFNADFTEDDDDVFIFADADAVADADNADDADTNVDAFDTCEMKNIEIGGGAAKLRYASQAKIRRRCMRKINK